MDNEDFDVNDETLQRYTEALARTPELCAEALAAAVREAREGSAIAYDVLWNQTAKVVLHIATRAGTTRQLPLHIARNLDALSDATLRAGSWAMEWNPEVASLRTYLTPRVLGAMLRYCSKDRQAGFTGNINDIQITDLESTGGTEEDLSDGPQPGISAKERLTLSDVLAYPVTPDGLEEPPDGAYKAQARDMLDALATLPALYRTVLQAYYGIDRRKRSLREICTELRLAHPQQVVRLVEAAQKSLLKRVTSGRK